MTLFQDMKASEIMSRATYCSYTSGCEQNHPLANTIEDIDTHDRFRLYNVDILPAQAYFYEHDLFLINAKWMCKDGKLEWRLDDNVKFTEYHFQSSKLSAWILYQNKKVDSPFTDKIDRIMIKLENGDGGDETIEIREESEEDIFYELMRETAATIRLHIHSGWR